MMTHMEQHRTAHIGWLRAAVLGANDRLISTASLAIGVAASGTTRAAVLIAGVAGLTAGSMAMADGEYVSVSSQADIERSAVAREREEVAANEDGELAELTPIYVGRGLTPALAAHVAQHLTAHDALAAHVRDELGMSAATNARPLQAALTSLVTFATGALLPVAIVGMAPQGSRAPIMTVGTLLLLAVLGTLAARVGGAAMWRGALRVGFWGALAMGVAELVGRVFGAIV